MLSGSVADAVDDGDESQHGDDDDVRVSYLTEESVLERISTRKISKRTAESDWNKLISGVPVCFPFTPYRPQVSMMVKVFTALDNKTNALLESPTGTGKSMSLLCSTIAWQQKEFKRYVRW